MSGLLPDIRRFLRTESRSLEVAITGMSPEGESDERADDGRGNDERGRSEEADDPGTMESTAEDRSGAGVSGNRELGGVERGGHFLPQPRGPNEKLARHSAGGRKNLLRQDLEGRAAEGPDQAGVRRGLRTDLREDHEHSLARRGADEVDPGTQPGVRLQRLQGHHGRSGGIEVRTRQRAEEAQEYRATASQLLRHGTVELVGEGR